MNHTAVRRAALLSCSVNVFCLLALMLVYVAVQPPYATPVSGNTITAESQAIQLPSDVACTFLRVQTIAIYDGPFYEDGSGREVVNVAAVILYNNSDELIPYANVLVDTDNGCLTFHGYMLLPRSLTLVPESSAQPYVPGQIRHIYAWHTVNYEDSSAEILITEEDDVTLRIENCAARDLENLKIYFKKYVDGVYIGGRPYELIIDRLPEEESVFVSPKYYVSGYSRVIYHNETPPEYDPEGLMFL